MMTITVKDIQPKNVRTDSNPNNDNKIRRSWVLQMPEEIQARIKDKLKVAEVRWAYYAGIDEAVSTKWVEIMRKYYEDSIAAGAKLVADPYGPDRLEDEFCVDADEHLIEAAFIVVNEVISEMA
ncbi:RNA polymerase binding [Serratia phage CHI14]|uniref:RNA polymerase binding protein n=2 Tax=Winklervirus chi14 TaxID=2560752 RepID=A0A1Z1LY40_9CAUD|nr:RNA polymerase binding [Serratia phage CHI14]ARW57475.1 RNA polymerase binding protein [Serratia phage CHI14]ARW57750.1 RNA polymerase binding protein [Serratia phage CBH8]